MPDNAHPAVMFEFIATDQSRLCDFYRAVFGWTYTIRGGFAYIDFPTQPRVALGGIGRSQPNTPGWQPGRAFYLAVEDLEATLGEVVVNGGAVYVEPSDADGYHFAMFTDPEGNEVGLLETPANVVDQDQTAASSQ